ncbi:4-hydroxybenzoate octaprenyltransferase [bacterium]|nr:4-hydroxybenzoate octaprenyltransferase [bacterium]
MHKFFNDKLIDAQSNNWVDLYVPKGIRPFFKLSRLDRPIGSWLLIIPCWWGVFLSTNVDPNLLNGNSLYILVACYIGGLLMRGAGCTWNDITDAKLDAKVIRTKNRPIPAGNVSKSQAFLWLILQCFLAFGILVTFNRLAIILGFLSLITVVIYPFTKRFTYWPQFFLGLSFNWGILLAYAANSGTLDYFCVGLYISAIAWTIFYDTIYSFQDLDDDKEVGIRSTGILFEANPKQYLTIFIVFIILTVGPIFYFLSNGDPIQIFILMSGIFFFSLHLTFQLLKLDIRNREGCLETFKSNRTAGLILTIFMMLATLTKFF